MVEQGLHKKLARADYKRRADREQAKQQSQAGSFAKASVRFASLFSVSLFAGILFGATCSFELGSTAATDPAYIVQLKYMIRGFNRLMPVMGAICLATTIGSALVAGARKSFYLQIGAIVCLAATGTVSGFLCSPIDVQIMDWNTQASPAEWAVCREQWWLWHLVRMTFALAALALLILTLMTRRGSTRPARLDPL